MTYRVGSQPPTGYVDWHEWADAQSRGGLKQTRCPGCLRWFFLQERHDCKEAVEAP